MTGINVQAQPFDYLNMHYVQVHFRLSVAIMIPEKMGHGAVQQMEVIQNNHSTQPHSRRRRMGTKVGFVWKG